MNNEKMHDHNANVERMMNYLTGEMRESDQTMFEQELETDATLKREMNELRLLLDQSKSWVMQEPPGMDRVKPFTIPSNVEFQPTPSKPHRFWRPLATAAVFALGVLFGIVVENQASLLNGKFQTKPSLTTNQQIIQLPIHPDTNKTKETNADSRKNQIETREEDGKVIIETPLKNQGSAIWIVDADFKPQHQSTIQ